MNISKIKYHLAMLKYINIDYIIIKNILKVLKKCRKLKKMCKFLGLAKKCVVTTHQIKK